MKVILVLILMASSLTAADRETSNAVTDLDAAVDAAVEKHNQRLKVAREKTMAFLEAALPGIRKAGDLDKVVATEGRIQELKYLLPQQNVFIGYRGDYQKIETFREDHPTDHPADVAYAQNLKTSLKVLDGDLKRISFAKAEALIAQLTRDGKTDEALNHAEAVAKVKERIANISGGESLLALDKWLTCDTAKAAYKFDAKGSFQLLYDKGPVSGKYKIDGKSIIVSLPWGERTFTIVDRKSFNSGKGIFAVYDGDFASWQKQVLKK